MVAVRRFSGVDSHRGKFNRDTAGFNMNGMILEPVFETQFNAVGGSCPRTPFIERIAGALHIFFKYNLAVMFPQELIHVATGKAFRSIIHKSKTSIAVKHIDEIRGVVDDKTMQLFRTFDLFLYAFCTLAAFDTLFNLAYNLY